MTSTEYDADGYADFSDERKPIRFKAQGERYECHLALAAGTGQKIAHAADGLDPTDAVGALSAFFRLVMDEASAERITKQLRDQSPASLTVAQGLKIMHHVMEKYGLRPTQPSSD